MNFAQQLNAAINSLTGEQLIERARTKLRQGEKTPEMQAKRRATMRAKRNALWGAAFAKHHGTATSEQIATTLQRSVGSINATLIDMRKEVPPAVEIVARVPCGSNNPKYLYRWLLD